MYSWRNFVDKFKRYVKLEGTEKRGLILTILLLSFIFSFRDWGIEQFDAVMGFSNLVLSLVIVIFAFAIRELTHRIIALWMGYQTKYKAWVLGLVIGLVVAFVSNGRLLFLAPGALVISHLEVHRLGKAFYGLSYKHLGWIAMSSSISLVLCAVLLKSLFIATGAVAVQKAMLIFIWIALFDMIPVPPFHGSMTFFGSRYVYVFVYAALIGCSAMLAYVSGIASVLGSIVLGALVLFVFFAYVDKKW